METYADADEATAAGDPPVDWEKVEAVAEIFTNAKPLDALIALYGTELVIL